MKLRRPSIIVLVALVTTGILAPASTHADDTNTARVIDFEFQNAPLCTAADWLARLTSKPVLVPLGDTSRFSYRTRQKLTQQEAIDVMTGILQTNGLRLALVSDAYYKLTAELAAVASAEKPHIDIELRDDRFRVNGSAVDQAALSQRLAALMSTGTEAWVRCPLSPSDSSSFEAGTKLLWAVHGVDTNRIYVECGTNRIR